MILHVKGKPDRALCCACHRLHDGTEKICHACVEQANRNMLRMMDMDPSARDRRLKRYRKVECAVCTGLFDLSYQQLKARDAGAKVFLCTGCRCERKRA